MIDKLTKIIPIGSVLLIVIGFLKMKLFYLLFNINISDFINISDVISSFIGDSIYIVFALFFYFYYLIENIKISDEFKEEEIRKDERIKIYTKVIEDQKKLKEKLDNVFFKTEIEVKTYSDEIETNKVKNNSKKDYPRIVFLIVISFLFIYCFFYPQTKYSTEIYIFIAIVFPVLVVKIFEKSVYLFDKYYYEAIIFSSIITIIGALINKEYYNIKYDNKYSNYIIKMDDEIITCDRNTYYVGKTENYLFIYNSKLNTSTAYKTDKLLYINLKK